MARRRLALVIEDDPGVADVVRYRLGRCGFPGDGEVVVAPHALAAMRVIDESEPDLVLLDQRLPRSDSDFAPREEVGRELLQYALRRRPKTPVIVMTAHAGSTVASGAAMASKFLKLGATDFMTKDFDQAPVPFEETVKAALDTEDPRRGAGETDPGNVFQRRGSVWTVTYAGRTVGVPHIVGMQYLAVLLQQPFRTIRADKLHAAIACQQNAPRAGKGSEVADDRALKEYAKTLRDIEDDLEDARKENDFGRIAARENDRDVLLAHVKAATASQGRKRRTGDAMDRIRLQITQALTRAMKRFADHEELHRHLARSIRRGVELSYCPDPPTVWMT